MSHQYWGEVKVEVEIEAEVELRSRLKWGFDVEEVKFSWNIVELGLSLVNFELRKKSGFHRIRVMVLYIYMFRCSHNLVIWINNDKSKFADENKLVEIAKNEHFISIL